MLKKLFFLSVVFLFSLNLYAIERIAILDFRADGVDEGFLMQIYNEFYSKTANSGRFLIVERKDLELILNEQQLQNTDFFNEETASEIGQLTGAETVFIGTVERRVNDFNLIIKGVTVETGVVKFVETVSAPNEEKLLAEVIITVMKISGKTADEIAEYRETVNAYNLIDEEINNMELNRDTTLNLENSFLGLSIGFTAGGIAVLAGSIISYGLYGYYYDLNLKAITISEIESSNLGANGSFLAGTGLGIGAFCVLIAAAVSWAYYAYIKNYDQLLENKRGIRNNLNNRTRDLLSFNGIIDISVDRLTFGLVIKGN